MSLSMSKYQKEVLNILLDTYENSATYKGENKKNQSFVLKPVKVFPDYENDFTDQDEINQFNWEMQELENANLVKLDYLKGMPVISKILLNTTSIHNVYILLEREDISEKRNREIEMYSEYLGIHRIIDGFSLAQIERLKSYKNAKFEYKVAFNILRLLKYILNNTTDMMERELSIAVLGDTKEFENSYRSRISNILEQYGEWKMDFSSFDKKEKEKIILEEYLIFPNPSYIFLKGNVHIEYYDGYIMDTISDNPIAVSSEGFQRVKSIKIDSNKIVTVENLTSYNRVKDSNVTFIYLSGYHNTVKQKWLRKIADDNKECLWYHFGDIDPDGFYILKNLRDKTGILFNPLYMNIEELDKYRQYTKPLEKNDTVKAASLIKDSFYPEIMKYMLNNNCKLEQEIISWSMNK